MICRPGERWDPVACIVLRSALRQRISDRFQNANPVRRTTLGSTVRWNDMVSIKDLVKGIAATFRKQTSNTQCDTYSIDAFGPINLGITISSVTVFVRTPSIDLP